jgi:hypothetical protein
MGRGILWAAERIAELEAHIFCIAEVVLESGSYSALPHEITSQIIDKWASVVTEEAENEKLRHEVADYREAREEDTATVAELSRQLTIARKALNIIARHGQDKNIDDIAEHNAAPLWFLSIRHAREALEKMDA